MSELDFSPVKLQIYGLHKSFGMLVFMLAALRLAWRCINPPPPHIQSHQIWERWLSGLVHVLLYIAMLAMPLSGWLMSSAGDFPNSFFGLFEIPDLIGKNEDAFKTLQDVHESLAYIILGLLALHTAGAFKHHFIDRDETLQRMTSRSLGFIGGGLIALVAGVFWLAPLTLPEILPDNSDDWAELRADLNAPAQFMEESDDGFGHSESAEDAWGILHDESQLNFTVTQYGQEFQGRFGRFDGRIEFDPEDLEDARTDIEIDITSIDTGSDDRDAQALDEEWFYAEKFTVARFRAREFERIGPESYRAIGTLRLRGEEKNVVLPFSLSISKEESGRKIAVMQAELTLDRGDFGIGQGQWVSGQAIGKIIKIQIFLKAAAL